MVSFQQRSRFTGDQLQIINQAVTMAEELVSNHYKMSASQWLHRRYDVKTLSELTAHEIVDGPFAQIIRYEGQRMGSALGSDAYDFYKICLQDHAILTALNTHDQLSLLPFALYIICHELVHIVRFSKFIQNFDATADEKLAEEHRVHAITHQILAPVHLPGIEPVIAYYARWRTPLENLGAP
ncbi:MAG: hypothetical protein KFF50_04730 [Desulfatitalea sp.]|nr:hypothetical protein [Desulfatitalea sp.]